MFCGIDSPHIHYSRMPSNQRSKKERGSLRLRTSIAAQASLSIAQFLALLCIEAIQSNRPKSPLPSCVPVTPSGIFTVSDNPSRSERKSGVSIEKWLGRSVTSSTPWRGMVGAEGYILNELLSVRKICNVASVCCGGCRGASVSKALKILGSITVNIQHIRVWCTFDFKTSPADFIFKSYSGFLHKIW